MSEFFSKLPNWLTHDYKLKPDYRALVWALIFVLLPNLVFLLGAYFTGLARPIINIDYFWVCLLWVMPYRALRYLGVLLFLGLAIMDAAMMAMQLFPFLDMAAAVSLAPFLLNAPVRYMVLVAIVVVYLCLMPVLMLKLSKKWFAGKFSWAVLLVVLVGLLAYHKFHEFRYIDREGERFAQSDYFYVHSQYKRYRWVADSEFADHFGKIPQMMPIDIAYISRHFGAEKTGITEPVSRPLVTHESGDKAVLGDRGMMLGDGVSAPADKLLLIVAESWGVARSSAAQKEILRKLYEQHERLAFLDTGYFAFSGATVEGELRELCQMDVEGGYSFSRLDAQALSSCLPHRLKAQGYHTIGMHAGYSAIYERDFLYPKMGFAQTIFAENYNHLERCSPFNGICDEALFEVVAGEFAKHNKLFYYWLTLTSHSPFSERDVRNPRFDCVAHQVPAGDLCNNFRLHTQFFDGLAKLLARPEMKGVEVIVVGDHMPPILRRGEIHPYIQWQDVSWVHLKVKP